MGDIQKAETAAKKQPTKQPVKQMTRKRKTIPVFYAADENYLPYLTVSLHSLKSNAKKPYAYEIYVLCEGVSKKAEKKLKKYEDENFRVEFVDVSQKLQEVKEELQLRDYYTGATYYRIFIAGMFPQFDKALYIDSDTVVLGDIADLYNYNLGACLVGAIPDGAVAQVPAFREYTKKTLGVDYRRYFNAGVLVMNLAQFRKDGFYEKFCALLQEYKFSVAQDQDYLNVLCKNKVRFIGGEWNRMPIGGETQPPKLIHYNLTMKPWHYDDVLFSEYFWEYAKQTDSYDLIKAELATYSETKKRKDAKTEKGLIALAEWEARREDRYIVAHKALLAKQAETDNENEWEEDDYGYVEDFSGETVCIKAH